MLHFAWSRDCDGVKGFSCLSALRRRIEAFARFRGEGGWEERRGVKEGRLSGDGRHDDLLQLG